MKTIKVYHENGKVKITKIAPSGIEQVMFSDLKDGDLPICEEYEFGGSQEKLEAIKKAEALGVTEL